MNKHHAVRTAHPTRITTGSRDTKITRRVHRAHRIFAASRNRLIPAREPLASSQQGFTLVELVVATMLAALLIAGLGGVVGQVATTRDVVNDKNELTRQARFAMDQMVRSVGHSRLLLLPLNDKPASSWPENIREQTVPASPPIPDSTLATAVLAFTLPEYSDLNGDGFPDADDDKDGLIDEDLGEDVHYDFAPGVYLIDDGGNGTVDEGFSFDDDETNAIEGEDPINGVDDDGDGNIDEDPSADINEDGCPGICGVDDDGDGSIDEGSVDDDDEDGQVDEDWYNVMLFQLQGGLLQQRTPVPWDESGGGLVGGQDFIVSTIAENVTRFRVERVAGVPGNQELVDITLELTSPVTGEMVSLQTQVRVGGAL